MKPILLLLCASALGAAAQTNSPGYDGYLSRSRQMYDTGNYVGCIDQLRSLDRRILSAAEREQADWLLALAAYATSGQGAAPHLRAFVANHPESLHRQQAMALIGDCLLASDPQAALEQYALVEPRALDADGRLALDYHRAYAHVLLGDYEPALPVMERLSAEPRYRSDAAYYAGYIYYTRHDYAQARRYLAMVAPTSAVSGYARYYQTQMDYAEGDYARAGEAARALAADRSLPADYRAEARRIYGEALWQQGKRQQAVKTLGEYVGETDSPAASALYILGIDAYRRADYTAVERYMQPVAQTQDNAMGQTAYLYTGEAMMHRGDRSGAILAFDRARSMSWDRAVREAALYDYAVAASQGASVPFASTVKVFEDYLRDYPDGTYAAQAQQYIVDGYLTDHDYDAALASINRMTHPSAAVLAAKQQVLYALGNRDLARGNDAAAAGYLEQALALRSHSAAVAAQTALSLGEVRYRQGRYTDAVELLNDYLRTAPATDANHALARYDLGYARLALGDYADAAYNFRKVVDGPGNLDNATRADAINRLADTYFHRSDWSDADHWYGVAYDANTAAGDYPLYRRAIIRGYQRDHSGKIAGMERMMREFPTSALTADALLEMTESYQQLGQTDRAIATYRRIVADYPGSGQGRRAELQLAMTLFNTGKRADAIDAYRDVIMKYPTSEEASVAADELKRISADEGTLGDFAAWLGSVKGAPQMDVSEADRLDFDAAERLWLTEGRADRLARYVERYPEGAYRPRALAYLTESVADRPEELLCYTSLILSDYPDSPQAASALQASAQAKYDLGRGEEALADWQALAARASSPAVQNTARAGIMRVARDMGDAPAMLAAADALLASSAPGAGLRDEATFTRGLAQSLQGHDADARATWLTIADDTDDIYGTKAAYYLAQSHYDNKNYKAAAERLERLIDSATPHTYWLARAFILLSDVHAAEGRKFEAREYLRSLRDNYPGTEADIRQMIDSRLENLK